MINSIICGDCLEVMKGIPDKSVDLVVTSPPYNIGKGGSSFKFPAYENDDDKNPNYDVFIVEVLDEIYRVLKPSGSLMFNHKVRTVKKEAIHPLRWIFNSEFALKQEIIWDLNDTHIHNKDRFYPINEMIYWCTKDKNETKFNGDLASLTTIWRIRRANKRQEGCLHPAPFAMQIPLNCIEATTGEGDVVLDPFVGSGTTAIASLNTGRYFIGIEKEEQYHKIACERVQKWHEENEEGTYAN